MTATSGETMTPEAAVQALARLERYEETLTAKASGITWMVWGIAVAGIFATYSAATLWPLEGPENAILSLLWAPWILAAMAVSNGIWRTQAIRFDSKYEAGKNWLAGLGFTLMFFVVWLVVWLVLGPLLGLTFDTSVLMVMVVGVFTMALTTVQTRMDWCPPGPGILAGVALIAAGLVLAVLGVSGMGVGLLAALIVLADYFALGLWFYARG